MSERVLVVHTAGGLGDVLLSTCVVDALQSAYPGASIDFLCNRSTAPALRGHPQIRELMTIDGKAPPWGPEWWAWRTRLRQRRYDVALILWSTSRMAWLLWAAGIPRRVGQDSRLLYSFLYTHRVRIRSEHGDTSSHWTEILLDYVRALGIRPGPPRVYLDVPAAAEARADELLGPRTGLRFGFHSSKGLKVGPDRWPTDAFARLAVSLRERFGAQLVLTGAESERPLVEPVARALPAEGCLNLCGQTDVPTLAAVARRCDVFLCPDSGPMHVAAAVGAPVVGIYALEEDFPQRWAPLSPRSRIVRPEVRGCYPGCLKATCPDFRCYRQANLPRLVEEAVESLLRSSP